MPSEWVQRAVDFIRGDDAFMHKQVPPEVGRKHVTELLHQHPFHPFSEDVVKAGPSHMCYQQNMIFFQCMTAMGEKDSNMPLHMKHVNCYHPYKTDLMRCLVSWRKQEKERMLAAVSGSATAAESSTSEKS